jgi:hypothetical protein
MDTTKRSITKGCPVCNGAWKDAQIGETDRWNIVWTCKGKPPHRFLAKCAKDKNEVTLTTVAAVGQDAGECVVTYFD